jgi:hypothetical protein
MDISLRCGNVSLGQSVVIGDNGLAYPGEVLTSYGTNSGGAYSRSIPEGTGAQLQVTADTSGVLAGGSLQDFAQGYLVASTPSTGSQSETGLWFSLYFSAALDQQDNPTCVVTGTAIPIGGNRPIPLPFGVGP